MSPGVAEIKRLNRDIIRPIELEMMTMDLRGTMTKAESTPYSGATLVEVMKLASDLRALSPDSALAALAQAKATRILMGKGDS